MYTYTWIVHTARSIVPTTLEIALTNQVYQFIKRRLIGTNDEETTLHANLFHRPSRLCHGVVSRKHGFNSARKVFPIGPHGMLFNVLDLVVGLKKGIKEFVHGLED